MRRSEIERSLARRMPRRSPIPQDKSHMKCIISVGLVLPALAAVIGVVAWAVSADVVMGPARHKMGDIRQSDMLEERSDFKVNIGERGGNQHLNAAGSFINNLPDPKKRDPFFMAPGFREKPIPKIGDVPVTTTTTTTTTTTELPPPTTTTEDAAALLSKILSASRNKGGQPLVVFAPLPEKKEQSSEEDDERKGRKKVSIRNFKRPDEDEDEEEEDEEELHKPEPLQSKEAAEANHGPHRFGDPPFAIHQPLLEFDSPQIGGFAVPPPGSIVIGGAPPPQGIGHNPKVHFVPMPASHSVFKRPPQLIPKYEHFNPPPHPPPHQPPMLFDKPNRESLHLNPPPPILPHNAAESNRWGTIGGGGYYPPPSEFVETHHHVHHPPHHPPHPKGITISIGGNPPHGGGGGYHDHQDHSVIKSLFLPFLPKPRVNLKGRVVFGVVLEKGIGLGGNKKEGHPPPPIYHPPY